MSTDERHATPRPIDPDDSERISQVAGWHDIDGRWLLVTHIPEADLGQPMILVGDDRRVWRQCATAYPNRRLQSCSSQCGFMDEALGGAS
jgi:hypothetical protein